MNGEDRPYGKKERWYRDEEGFLIGCMSMAFVVFILIVIPVVLIEPRGIFQLFYNML